MRESRNQAPVAPLLSIRNLSIALPKGGDRPHAVRDIDFDIGAGNLAVLIAPQAHGDAGSGRRTNRVRHDRSTSGERTCCLQQ